MATDLAAPTAHLCGRAPVLLLLLGATPTTVAVYHGVFSDWFGRLWRDVPVTLNIVDGTQLGNVPDPRDYAGVILSGSPASLTEPEPWMEAAVELVRQAAQVGTPVLGVCFGHQVIGAAYGGSVIPNPRGWSMSTHTIEVTEPGDPLLSDIPDVFSANLSHRDVVAADTLAVANGIRTLARRAPDDVQIVAAGDAVRGIQFHPEFNRNIMRAYVALRRDVLAADAAERGDTDAHPDALFARAANTPHAEHVFHNFTQHWILRS